MVIYVLRVIPIGFRKKLINIIYNLEIIHFYIIMSKEEEDMEVMSEPESDVESDAASIVTEDEIVDVNLDDVDLEAAVTMGMKQCFFNTGQSCSSPTSGTSWGAS